MSDPTKETTRTAFLQRTTISASSLVAGLLLALIALSCEEDYSPARPNLPPHTKMANIPKDGDTLFALATLHWDGFDYDGYVARYQYRYVTVHVGPGDSVVQPWRDTAATSLTIPFISDSAINLQTFYVRAVDNSGAVADTPAVKRFYTWRAIPPQARILIPSKERPQDPDPEYFAIGHVTDWWPGIDLVYTADDQDGAVVEYAWSVDGSPWNWTTDTSVFVPPERFSSLTGTHILQVICRDNTNLIDPVGSSIAIRLVNPTFSSRILIVDETDERTFPTGVKATDAQVDSFYQVLFGPADSWDYFGQGSTIPTRSVLGQYRMIVWHADNRPTDPLTVHRLPNHTDVLQDYLNVGGKLFMSGWRILKSFAWDQSFPVGFEPGTFVHDYLHIVSADETALIPDFTYAEGYGGFSRVRVDSAKLANAFPFAGKLAQVNFMGEQQIGGFAQKAYLYQNDSKTGIIRYRGSTCGIIYYGTSFDVIVLGFPIFFMNGSDAQVMVHELLGKLGL